MANPAPTINQINAFNATQGTIIDFNIIGGTELVRSNKIYIYDLSDNSLICTHLYVSTESIHELPANTDGSIVYESGKSSADFVNGKQYYAQIQTFTDIAGTEGGSGLSVSKLFWCLVDPTLTITTIPSTISTTSYNVSATYNANTSVVSNIIQQYQFNLYSATGSLLQSSGVIVGNGEQQGTSTAYDISYNFSGLSVGSSYYVVVNVTTTQGMSVNAQSNTFTVSIDTPTLGEATVVNNACDGYISVTSNLSGEYGGSASGEIATFETDSVNRVTKLEVELEPIQDLHGYDKPWPAGGGVNIWDEEWEVGSLNGSTGVTTRATNDIVSKNHIPVNPSTSYYIKSTITNILVCQYDVNKNFVGAIIWGDPNKVLTTSATCHYLKLATYGGSGATYNHDISINYPSSNTGYFPYENICPIVGHSEVEAEIRGKNLIDWEITEHYFDSNFNGYGQSKWQDKMPIPKDLFGKQVTYSAYINAGNTNNQCVRVWFLKNGSYVGSAISGNYIQSNNSGISKVTFTIANSDTVDSFALGLAVNDSTVSNPQLELGSTATDYVPYVDPTTIVQSFNVTLTPTVIDETPYLFKKTGDVRGDRESLEIVGGTVAWNQLVKNPELNNTNNIYGSNGTVTASNGMATITANGVASAYFSFSIDKTIINHVYVVSTDVKLDGNNQSNAPTNAYIVTNWSSGGSKAIPSATKGTKKTYSTLLKPTVGDVDKLHFYPFETSTPTPNGDKAYFSSPLLIDITQLLGSTIADYIYSLEQANAGAGVAWFKKLFPKPYYAYNAGELMSVQASSHDMVGFNQWDEEWETGGISNANGQFANDPAHFRSKNYIRVLPNTSYCFTHLGNALTNFLYFYWYDADKNFISYGNVSGVASVHTSPSNACYMRFRNGGNGDNPTYNHDICINLHWDGSRDGEYEEYKEHTYPLDDSLTLRGIPKLDASNNLYYDGDTYESDGTVTRKYGIVDLGTLTYTVSSSDTFYAIISDKMNGHGNIMCAKYVTASQAGVGNMQDKQVVGENGGKAVYVKDSALSGYTTAQVKTAMSGVYLVYELATPTTETADPFTDPQEVSIYGTEEFVSSNGVPVGNKTTYKTRDIFGGTIDLASGVLTVDRIVRVFNGDASEDWSYSSAWASAHTSVFYLQTQLSGALFDDLLTSYLYCNELKPLSRDELYQADYDAIGYSGTPGRFPYLTLRISNTLATTAEALKTWLFANNLQIAYELATPLTYQLTPHEIETLIGTNNVWSNAGDVLIEFNIPITNLLVKRQDVADVSGNWLTLYSQPVEQASDMDFTFIDFLNQYGKTYKYALVPLLAQTQSGVEVEVEGGYTVSDEVQSIFDGVYIGDSTSVQRLKSGVAYNNLNTNQQVGVIPTLGNKYPIVVSNGNIQYDTGSVSGLIVPDDFYSNGNLSRLDMSDKREIINDFLTNKKPKILKDWNGNIWLVVFTDNVDVSFDNNYGMGIATFTSGWTEVGDPTNQEDLQKTGLINVGGD